MQTRTLGGMIAENEEEYDEDRPDSA